ncbi:MAG TPA: methionyl-tRNA formyltransferase [Steroidobacteraceae bacterium]|nr:methionyl-tRNA formyltransferase [Steroidobacteraceae bacterium]
MLVLRVAFAGTPEFARPALAALLESHTVVGVLTQPDRASGRGLHLRASPVKALAEAHRLPLLQPASLRGEAARGALAAWKPEVLVVAAYGLILPPAVLALPRYGCLNIHASLLPRWRGAAPVQRAILAGDKVTGVTIMQMDEGLDTGPMLLRREIGIGADDTGGSLHAALATLGAAAILEALEGVRSGTLRAQPQPPEGATYAAKIARSEALIDWSRDAASIERQVRAFDPWPIAETTLDGERLRIHSASNMTVKDRKKEEIGTIVSVRDGIMRVQCGEGLLGVLKVQKPGGRILQVSEFAHNLRLAGRRLG